MDPVRASILIQAVSKCLPCFCYNVKNNSNLKSNLEDLDKKIKNLTDLRDQVQQRLMESPEENGDGIRDTTKAEEWLKKVESLERSAISVRERLAAGEKGRARTAYEEWEWKSGLSSEVVGLLEEAKRLKKDGSFENLFEAKLVDGS